MKRFDVRELIDNMDRRIWYSSPDDCEDSIVYYREQKAEFNPWCGDPKAKFKQAHWRKRAELKKI